MKYYDNTRVSAYKECPRSFYLRHVRDLVPESEKIYFTFGSAWHEAQDVIWQQVNNGALRTGAIAQMAIEAFLAKWTEEKLPAALTLEQEERMLPRTPMVAKEMIYAYIEARQDFIRECELLAVERPFAVPLYPGDDKSNPIYIGRFDKVVKHRNSGIIAIEHKTTTAYKKDGGFRSDWVDSWSPNSQVEGYIHAGRMIYGEAFKGVWIDGALVHKTVHDKFKFIPIAKATSSMDAWLLEAREWIDRIRMDSNRLDFERESNKGINSWFPRNTGACGSYAGCVYRDICRYTANPDREDSFAGFVTDKWEPFDLLKIEQLGLERE